MLRFKSFTINISLQVDEENDNQADRNFKSQLQSLKKKKAPGGRPYL